MENIFSIKDYPYYKQYKIQNQELLSFLKDIFECDFFCSFQLLKNGIAIHKDIDRTECINYIIDPGGNSAALNLYDDNKNITLSEQIPACKWHWIDVSRYHGVTGITNTRYSISVGHFTRSINDFV